MIQVRQAITSLEKIDIKATKYINTKRGKNIILKKSEQKNAPYRLGAKYFLWTQNSVWGNNNDR